MFPKENTQLKWTSTENMFVDARTKDMDMSRMHKILKSCRWCCARYTTSFIKQSSKGSKKKVAGDDPPTLLGSPVPEDDPVLPHLSRLCERSGWHDEGEVAVHVARHAKSYRTRFPRFDAATFPCRSSFARIDFEDRQEWRKLEDAVRYCELQNPQQMLGGTADRLITFFQAAIPDAPKGRNRCESMR